MHMVVEQIKDTQAIDVGSLFWERQAIDPMLPPVFQQPIRAQSWWALWKQLFSFPTTATDSFAALQLSVITRFGNTFGVFPRFNKAFHKPGSATNPKNSASSSLGDPPKAKRVLTLNLRGGQWKSFACSELSNQNDIRTLLRVTELWAYHPWTLFMQSILLKWLLVA